MASKLVQQSEISGLISERDLVVRVRRAVLPVLVLCGWGSAAIAQAEQPRVIDNPPLVEIERRAAPLMTLMNVPTSAPAQADEATLTLDVEYVSSRIWNPAEGRFDKVKLRGYRWRGAPILADGTTISLQADTGNFMARCRNCLQGEAYPDNVAVHLSAATEPYSRFKVKNVGNGKVTLQADTGKYVARCRDCVPNGVYPDFLTVHVTDPSAAYAQFKVNRLSNGKITLQADTGKYVARCRNCAPNAAKEDNVTIHITNPSLPYAQWVVVGAEGVNPDAPYVGPTIETVPGETVRLTLNNRLPRDPDCIKWDKDMNEPHCFNGTNMHTHGLWVNPSGNGDNVLISVNPGVSFQYEYNIPPDHPAGTFWYHPHRHGSTALQVSSGMAGALIIRGTRQPTQTGNGDIDTLLTPFPERVLVLQQIQYACRDDDGKGKIKTHPDGTYKCDLGDDGTIEGYDQFGPGTWPKSGRYTSINGHVLPTFSDAKAGQIERWRIIHAGVRDSISLEFRKRKPRAESVAGLKASDNDAYVAENCTGEALPYHLIAADGLTLAAAMRTEVAVFQPGYRWDALLVFPEAGEYCVIDASAPPAASVNQAAPSRQLLGIVTVANGSDVPGDITAYLTSRLVSAAESKGWGKVVRELKSGLKLTSFVAHRDIEESEVTGMQELVFNIVGGQFQISNSFQVNGKPFDPKRVDRVLTLGGVDEWTLRSDFVSHPFHIHVNPFQIVEIRDPNGKDVSAPGAVDDFGGTPDPQYPGLKGVWKDTLWVKNLSPGPAGRYTLVVRTRYERYIGDFVLHCHILDHEDRGMMQLIRIALPES